MEDRFGKATDFTLKECSSSSMEDITLAEPVIQYEPEEIEAAQMVRELQGSAIQSALSQDLYSSLPPPLASTFNHVSPIISLNVDDTMEQSSPVIGDGRRVTQFSPFFTFYQNNGQDAVATVPSNSDSRDVHSCSCNVRSRTLSSSTPRTLGDGYRVTQRSCSCVRSNICNTCNKPIVQEATCNCPKRNIVCSTCSRLSNNYSNSATDQTGCNGNISPLHINIPSRCKNGPSSEPSNSCNVDCSCRQARSVGPLFHRLSAVQDESSNGHETVAELPPLEVQSSQAEQNQPEPLDLTLRESSISPTPGPSNASDAQNNKRTVTSDIECSSEEDAPETSLGRAGRPFKKLPFKEQRNLRENAERKETKRKSHGRRGFRPQPNYQRSNVVHNQRPPPNTNPTHASQPRMNSNLGGGIHTFNDNRGHSVLPGTFPCTFPRSSTQPVGFEQQRIFPSLYPFQAAPNPSFSTQQFLFHQQVTEYRRQLQQQLLHQQILEQRMHARNAFHLGNYSELSTARPDPESANIDPHNFAAPPQTTQPPRQPPLAFDSIPLRYPQERDRPFYNPYVNLSPFFPSLQPINPYEPLLPLTFPAPPIFPITPVMEVLPFSHHPNPVAISIFGNANHLIVRPQPLEQISRGACQQVIEKHTLPFKFSGLKRSENEDVRGPVAANQ